MRLKRIKQAVAMFIGSLVVTSSFPIFASANSSDYEYELDLTCSSTHYFDDEEDTTTYFYAETDYEGESVTLVNADDLTEYTMLDDGKFSVSGDDLPYDGVYSAKIELDTNGATYESPKILSFYAITEDGVRSKTISIKIVKRITDIQISEMNSVNEAINALVESENYTLASFEEKSSMVYELLVNLSECVTEEYPYSLIFPDSINFTGKTYAFKYSCGALGGVSITDPFQTETTTTTTNITTEITTTFTTPTTTVSIEETNPTTITTEESTTTSSVKTTTIATTTIGEESKTSSVETTTTTTTTTTDLPQTGYSKWYRTIVAFAICMTGIGGIMVIGSGALKKKRR